MSTTVQQQMMAWVDAMLRDWTHRTPDPAAPVQERALAGLLQMSGVQEMIKHQIHERMDRWWKKPVEERLQSLHFWAHQLTVIAAAIAAEEEENRHE